MNIKRFIPIDDPKPLFTFEHFNHVTTSNFRAKKVSFATKGDSIMV